MSTITANPVSKATLLRLTNLSRRKGERLLRELGVQPSGTVGNSIIYPADTIGELLKAAAKDNTKPAKI